MPVNFLVVVMYNTVHQKVTKEIFSTQFPLIICWSVYFPHRKCYYIITDSYYISMKFIIISSVYALAAVNLSIT